MVLGRNYTEILEEHLAEVVNRLNQFVKELAAIDHKLSDARSQSLWSLADDIQGRLAYVVIETDDEKTLGHERSKLVEVANRLRWAFSLLEPYQS
ncbi:hypothetical protein H6G04_27040 [Calothrix membranacea FACHB-236]|nr:hypothetical protein [Calothrix membranacea FACHB-236]